MARLPVNQPYRITTKFGVPDPNALFGRHSGIDYAVPLNRPIYAPASGQLTNVVTATGGNMVKIFDGQYYHRLMHNNSFSRSNGPVKEGEEVAKAGTTGLSTGVHSHWDIVKRPAPFSFSDFLDPMEYIEGMESFNKGDRYNLLFHTVGKKYADEAAAKNYFGNEIGKPYKQSVEVIIGSKQFKQWLAQDGVVLKPGKYNVL